MESDSSMDGVQRLPSLKLGKLRIPAPFLKVAIWLSIISVLSLSYQFIISNTFNRNFRHFNFTLQERLIQQFHNMEPSQNLQPNAPTARTSLNPRMIRKIERLHRHLNRTEMATLNMYPAYGSGKFILLNPTLCKDAHTIDVVIIVHTAPPHYGDRQRIRDSFAKRSLFLPFEVRVAFLLGTTLDPKVESVLMLEQHRNGDLVMGEFIDSSHNLTLKGVMGYHWVSEHCSNSKFVLKIDDDVLINMYKLLYSFLGHMQGKPKSIFCNIWFNNSMPILRKGKWKVPDNMFSKMEVFPYDYCSGFTVVMTSDLMGPMYEAAKRTPFFWIDDVYLFGILPSMVGGVTYYNYPLDKNTTLNDKVALNCTQKYGTKCTIFATIISQPAYWKLWGMIQNLFAVKPWNAEKRVVD